MVGDEQEGRLLSLQARLEEAVVAVKATTMATRNNNKFKIPAEIRKLATEAARCRNPILRGRPDDNLIPGLVFFIDEIAQRAVVKKLLVAGRASEDREAWMEEVEAHCERCDDDKGETSEVHVRGFKNNDAGEMVLPPGAGGRSKSLLTDSPVLAGK